MELALYILSFLVVAGVVKLLFSLSDHMKDRKRMNKIPSISPTSYPMIGGALFLRGNPDEMYGKIKQSATENLIAKGSEIGHLWLGPVPVVLIVGPQTAEVLLRSSENIEKSFFYTFLHSWLGTGLLTAGGKKWKSRRRLLTPTFHFSILQDFLDVMNEQASVFAGKFETCSESGEIINIFQSVTLCALDIICETAMGKAIHAQNSENTEYVKAIHSATDLVQDRQKSPWLWWDNAFYHTHKGKKYARFVKIMHDFTKAVIKDRMRNFKAGTKKKRRLAFLDMLLEASNDGNVLSFTNIQEEVDTFMFEGHDTTAAAMTWAIHLIGRHSDVQDRIHAELDEVLGKDTGRIISMEDIKKLEYLEMVIKESLRLFPSVPIMGRRLTSDVILEGHEIPAGSECILFPQLINTNENYWPEAEKFDPDRFTKENSVGRHPFSYIPFSAGPRNCIGQKFAIMEEKVILAYFFHKYSVTSTDRTEDLRLMGDIILRPGDGVNVRIRKRN